MAIFQTVEFYIITAFIAAAVIAASAMPSRRAAARTYLFAGELSAPADGASRPGIVVLVNDRGNLEIYRFGLENVCEDGAYSLAVTITGVDVTIEERLTAGRLAGTEATVGHAVLDCFGAERYHFNYRNEKLRRSCAFYLNIRPGNRVERTLDV